MLTGGAGPDLKFKPCKSIDGLRPRCVFLRAGPDFRPLTQAEPKQTKGFPPVSLFLRGRQAQRAYLDKIIGRINLDLNQNF